MILNLGFISLRLLPFWTALAESEISTTLLVFRKNNASAKIQLISAGIKGGEEFLEKLYNQRRTEIQYSGRHFNDMAEDFDYEMTFELESKNEFKVAHLFMRLFRDVILVAVLNDYQTEEEEEFRTILESGVRTNIPNFHEQGKTLEIQLDLQQWSRLGRLLSAQGDM